MSCNESPKHGEKKPNAFRGSTAACCQPCMPGSMPFSKHAAEQQVKTAEEQAKAQSTDQCNCCDVPCGCKGNGEQTEIV